MTEIPDTNLTNQELAQRYSKVVQEWDGTPFRVDMIRNFPPFVRDEDLWELLSPISRLADQIEKQIGYRVVEMGNLIDTPAGAAPGWNTNFEHYWRNDYDNSLLPREAHQILVFYMDDDNPHPWDYQGGPTPQSAHVCCGTISYNKRAMGSWWSQDDPTCTGASAANGRDGEAIVHEVFHILGFRHPDNEPLERGVPMCEGPLYRPWTVGSSIHYASPRDIDTLQCIFPK